LVVGAGITGITTAHLLAQAGKRVIVIEMRGVGSGETGNTTAHLTEVLDARYHRISQKFGQQSAQHVAESKRKAIDYIERCVGRLGIDCGFRRVPGFLFTETQDDIDELKEELEALHKVASRASWVDKLSLPFAVAGALRIENQAQFHPLRYLEAVVKEMCSMGVKIYSQTRIIDVQEGQPCRATTDRGVITARDVVLATHVPVTNRVALHMKIAAYRSYAVAGQTSTKLPLGLYWDTADPYHYIRAVNAPGSADESWLIIGGEDHKTGTQSKASARYRNLERYAERFALNDPAMRWSGQIMEPVDGLPFIGTNTHSKHVYVATGYAGQGMTYGTLAGLLLSDAITGQTNPWAEIYSATRIKPAAQVNRFVAENIDYPAHIVRDRFVRGEVASVNDIPLSEGKLVRIHGKMLAVFRDSADQLHYQSAVCPHLGCYVRWNNTERSWDCPCHGSRFDVLGKVLNGPAVSDLQQSAQTQGSQSRQTHDPIHSHRGECDHSARST